MLLIRMMILWMLHVDQDDDPLDVVDLDVADVTDVARGAVVMLCCF